MARRLRGRAWGNALGGYKTQRRDSKGRFASGKIGGKARSSVKRAKRKYNNRGGRAAKTLRVASKRPYNKAALNKQLQNNHRLTIAGSYVGNYGGGAVGAAIGGATGGAPGAMLGRQMGMITGQVAVQSALVKSGRLVTDQQFIRAGKDDQAAMARRIRRAQKGHLAIQGAMIGHTTHRLMQMHVPGKGNLYGQTAANIRQHMASKGPRKARAGRFGGNRGVYNISSMGPRVPFM